MLNDYFKYTISEHLLSAIVNGDYSGLDNDEENELNRFLSTANQYENATWDMPEHEDPHFAFCDVTGLRANCFDVKLHFTREEI